MKLLGRVSVGVIVSVLSACSSQPTAPTPPRQPNPVPTPALTISCPQNVTASAIAGTQVPVTFGQATATGGVAPVQVSCTRQSGSMFGGGTTAVQCTATDAAAHSTSCVFSVTVTVVEPRLTKTKFLAFGDSMTAGEMGRQTDTSAARNWVFYVDPASAYPTKLKAALGARYPTQAAAIDVVNSGWPGEWAQDGAKRLEQVLPSVRPDVLIVLEGMNDIASMLERGVNPAGAAIDRMAREARNRGVSLILATLPPPRPPGDHAVADSLIRALNGQIRGIAAGENAVLVDFYAGLSTNLSRYISNDGLHPTDAGYERMAELVMLAIRANFEAKTP